MHLCSASIRIDCSEISESLWQQAATLPFVAHLGLMGEREGSPAIDHRSSPRPTPRRCAWDFLVPGEMISRVRLAEIKPRKRKLKLEMTKAAAAAGQTAKASIHP